MARISNLGMSANKAGTLAVLLTKQIRLFNGGIKTWQQIIEQMPDNPEKEVIDGMIDWSRRKFNRMDGRDQEAYEKKLKARRLYVVDGMIMPKTLFDAVIGTVIRDVDRKDAA